VTSLSQIIKGFDGAGDFMPPPEWLQGRTVYGGLTAALALQAVLLDFTGALPPLKSALISFVGPATGPLRFQTRLLRQGKSATSITADGFAGSDVCLRAEFLFAAPRPSQVRHDYYSIPQVRRPDDYAPINAGGKAPASLGNFDLRPTGTALPMSGASYPELVAWVRHEDATDVDPAIALIALADSLPPAAIATLTDMVPFSSMMWTLDLPHPAQPNVWHLMRSTSQRARDGYSFQTMEVWDEGGALVLSGSQTVAVFG
jgi:acyl-CoA thioesterase